MHCWYSSDIFNNASAKTCDEVTQPGDFHDDKQVTSADCGDDETHHEEEADDKPGQQTDLLTQSKLHNVNVFPNIKSPMIQHTSGKLVRQVTMTKSRLVYARLRPSRVPIRREDDDCQLVHNTDGDADDAWQADFRIGIDPKPIEGGFSEMRDAIDDFRGPR